MILQILLVTSLLGANQDPWPIASPADSAASDTLLATRLSSEEIDDAIAQGLARKEFFGLGAGALAGGLGGAIHAANLPVAESAFGVSMQGPWGRIATAAGLAAKKYQPFTRTDVTPAIAAPLLVLLATPKTPVLSSGRWFAAPEPIYVVVQTLKRKGVEPTTVQPLFVQPFPVTWTNLMGGSKAGQGIRAIFAQSSLPTQDFG